MVFLDQFAIRRRNFPSRPPLCPSPISRPATEAQPPRLHRQGRLDWNRASHALPRVSTACVAMGWHRLRVERLARRAASRLLLGAVRRLGRLAVRPKGQGDGAAAHRQAEVHAGGNVVHLLPLYLLLCHRLLRANLVSGRARHVGVPVGHQLAGCDGCCFFNRPYFGNYCKKSPFLNWEFEVSHGIRC